MGRDTFVAAGLFNSVLFFSLNGSKEMEMVVSMEVKTRKGFSKWGRRLHL